VDLPYLWGRLLVSKSFLAAASSTFPIGVKCIRLMLKQARPPKSSPPRKPDSRPASETSRRVLHQPLGWPNQHFRRMDTDLRASSGKRGCSCSGRILWARSRAIRLPRRMGCGSASWKTRIAEVEVARLEAKSRGLKRPYPGWPVTGSDFSIADSPFQTIWVPMQTSKNEDSRMITLIEVAPNTWASRSENA